MIVPRILAELCGPDRSPTQHLETQQALVKQFAEILEFTLKFDELKVRVASRMLSTWRSVLWLSLPAFCLLLFSLFPFSSGGLGSMDVGSTQPFLLSCFFFAFCFSSFCSFLYPFHILLTLNDWFFSSSFFSFCLLVACSWYSLFSYWNDWGITASNLGHVGPKWGSLNGTVMVSDLIPLKGKPHNSNPNMNMRKNYQNTLLFSLCVFLRAWIILSLFTTLPHDTTVFSLRSL